VSSNTAKTQTLNKLISLSSVISLTFDCKGKKDGFYKDPENAHYFYECTGGRTANFTCPLDLVYNETINACDFTAAFDCEGKKNGFYKDPESAHKFFECVGGKAINFTCPENLAFDETKKICRFANDCEGKKNGFYKDPENTHSFFKCDGGRAINFTCPEDFVFDETKQVCSFAFDCKGKKDAFYKDSENARYFFECLDGRAINFTCPEDLVFDETKKVCRFANDCEGKKDGFYKDPENAHYFFKCDGGRAINFTCPEDFVFDETKQVCAFRETTAQTTKLTTAGLTTKLVAVTSTQKPTPSWQFSEVCKDKPDGLYKDPNNTHKYFKCSSSLTYHETCPADLFFNDTRKGCDFSTTSDPKATTAAHTTAKP
jgi:hypothetical protein